MTFSVYVAAAFKDAPLASAAIAKLDSHGVGCTYDWTSAADDYPNDDAPYAVRKTAARLCLVGVHDADAVLVVTTDRGMRGGWVELGAALAWGVYVVVVGPQRNALIFDTCCTTRFATVDEAVKHLVERASDDAESTPDTEKEPIT